MAKKESSPAKKKPSSKSNHVLPSGRVIEYMGAGGSMAALQE